MGESKMSFFSITKHNPTTAATIKPVDVFNAIKKCIGKQNAISGYDLVHYITGVKPDNMTMEKRYCSYMQVTASICALRRRNIYVACINDDNKGRVFFIPSDKDDIKTVRSNNTDKIKRIKLDTNKCVKFVRNKGHLKLSVLFNRPVLQVR